jgi:hypothetical protein
MSPATTATAGCVAGGASKDDRVAINVDARASRNAGRQRLRAAVKGLRVSTWRAVHGN